VIVQGILDFISSVLSGLIDLIPPLPGSTADSLAAISGSGSTLGAILTKLGILIPWGTVSACLTVWVGLITYWGASLLVRVILWLVGR